MANILIIYSSFIYPLPSAVINHLYSFQRYSTHRCFYLNMGIRRIPWYLKKVNFDLIIFDTIFLAMRWDKPVFRRLMEKAQILKQVDAVKVALPQDEFINTDILCDFINDFGIDYVFSVAPATEWPKIYDTVNFEKVKFYQVLTGYIDEKDKARINLLSESIKTRTIDIGYRAWEAQPWLGRHGIIKKRIAELFQKYAPQRKLVTDISLRREDTLLGDDWYKFLLNCKYTIGVEGGASVLDRDGTIKKKAEWYLKAHPDANFEEVEKHCFPGRDGHLELYAISPRHLEACVTRTCQILTEGKYNNILQPGIHYIEMKRDFSNMDEVLDIVKQDTVRNEISERCYKDIVKSGKYTFTSFVDEICDKTLRTPKPFKYSLFCLSQNKLIYYWFQFLDKLSQQILLLFSYMKNISITIFGEEIVIRILRRSLGIKYKE